MSTATLRLVLLVSCAHALVHVYELSLPSLELQIASQYVGASSASEALSSQTNKSEVVQAGRRKMGLLSNTWRLPFGFGALLAGWLVSRWGSRRMLVVYLAGCSAACFALGEAVPFASLFPIMFMMGSFASIYHPAGLTLISLETLPHDRARALGLHGIFGSAGIAAAPLLVAMLGQAGADWRQIYLMLSIPGAVLAVLLMRTWRSNQHAAPTSLAKSMNDEPGQWRAFGILTVLTILQGLVYAGFICFLTRYLATSPMVSRLLSETSDSTDGRIASASLISAAVLGMGCIGQYSAGRFAKLGHFERQLLQVTAMNIPLLIWMSLAEGNQRVWAAATFSVVHFMHQPLYNSLVAVYTPVARRSFCYGFSFAMSFGFGSFGASIVGFSVDDRQAYLLLAGVASLSTLAAFWLWTHQSRSQPSPIG